MKERLSGLRIGGRAWLAALAAAAVLVIGLSLAAKPERTQVKPGMNFFSPQQDIELGQKASADVPKTVLLLNDPRVDNYLNRLGQRLAAHAPGYRYPYQYQCVNSMDINAFALPGGKVYINRGVIELADDEAQLAGVMAHETSHVALRHSTNQISKAYLIQAPLSLVGGALGGGSIGALLAQLGLSSGGQLLFLKFSRTDESQADILGTQILYDSGYDPRGMSQFFEKIEAENKSRPIQFLSDHPNPQNRVARVDEEVDRLGGPPPNAKTDSPEFQEIKRYVKSLPPPPKGRTAPRGASNQTGPPPAPSARLQSFRSDLVALQYPDNWQSYGQGSTFALAPSGGLVDDGQGSSALAYGVIINVFDPDSNSENRISLDDATNRLIEQIERSNPQMSVARRSERARVGGAAALSTYLKNVSPVTGAETDWLVTVDRGTQLLYFICVAPERDFDAYDHTFQAIISSASLN